MKTEKTIRLLACIIVTAALGVFVYLTVTSGAALLQSPIGLVIIALIAIASVLFYVKAFKKPQIKENIETVSLRDIKFVEGKALKNTVSYEELAKKEHLQSSYVEETAEEEKPFEDTSMKVETSHSEKVKLKDVSDYMIKPPAGEPQPLEVTEPEEKVLPKARPSYRNDAIATEDLGVGDYEKYLNDDFKSNDADINDYIDENEVDDDPFYHIKGINPNPSYRVVKKDD
ncbi:MAG: hypothetical protein MJ129_04465 [Clostridia bacterium]|nr:hypothetical protein [Clostridia bacterium]